MPISFNNVDKVYHGTTPIKKVYRGSAVEWEEPVNYFRIVNENAGANTISLTKNGTPTNNITLDYSIDNGSTWTTWSSANGNLSVNLAQGDELLFKGDNATFSTSNTDYFTFGATANISAAGNIMTLIDSTGQSTSLANHSYCFYSLFNGSTTLVSIMSLVMPATTLANYCYQSMFYGCTGITSIPSDLLPATNLAEGCYRGLFMHTGITSIPSGLLPATNLANYCYYNLFNSCTGITSIPSDLLPVTTLANYCYQSMFYGCTGITSIPSGLLPATTLANYCYYSLFGSCTGITSIPSDLLPATNLAEGCYRGLLASCTSLITAPNLPATTLATGCYQNMMNGCSSLNSVTIYATNISASNCLNNWLYGVAASGTLNNNGNAELPTNSVSGVPSGWTEVSDRASYFAIKNEYAGTNTFTLTKNGSPNAVTLDYKLNTASSVSQWSSSSGNLSVNIPQGGTLYLRSHSSNNFSKDYDAYYAINCSKNYSIAGDISRLLNKNGNVATAPTRCFNRLFQNSTTLINAKNAYLPSTTLNNSSYYAMFSGCNALVGAPEIFATNLGSYNLSSMGNMFVECTSLNYIKVHFTSWIKQAGSSGNYSPTSNWTAFKRDTTGTFYKKSALPNEKNASGNPYSSTSGLVKSYQIPYGWTVTNF